MTLHPTDPSSVLPSDDDDASLWAEIKRLRADLFTLRSDLQNYVISHAQLSADIKRAKEDIVGIERHLSESRSALEERITTKIDAATRAAVLDVKDALKERVTVDRYRPVELVVYGLISLIAGSIVLALIALLLAKHGAGGG